MLDYLTGIRPCDDPYARKIAQTVLSGYRKHLFKGHGSCEAVAKRSALDRRTAKRYIVS